MTYGKEALYLAESYRDKALMDNDYAADGYARDMELEHIYAGGRKAAEMRKGAFP